MADDILSKIEKLAERVTDYLGVEIVPIEFDDTIEDDSRLTLRPDIKILINAKFEDNYFECAKAIVHEYRHLFQILWAFQMEDKIAKRWRNAFHNATSSENADIITNVEDTTKYATQEIELDAFAFTKYYLEKHEGMEVNHPSAEYEKLIKQYILVNMSRIKINSCYLK